MLEKIAFQMLLPSENSREDKVNNSYGDFWTRSKWKDSFTDMKLESIVCYFCDRIANRSPETFIVFSYSFEDRTYVNNRLLFRVHSRGNILKTSQIFSTGSKGKQY